jgi:hypothetical protein
MIVKPAGHLTSAADKRLSVPDSLLQPSILLSCVSHGRQMTGHATQGYTKTTLRTENLIIALPGEPVPQETTANSAE